MRTRLPIWCSALVLLLAAAAPHHAAAETYPSRPIRLIVPFPPGGAADILARLIGNKVAEQVGQPIIVENKPGAGGTLGADAAAKSPPDGYTILHNTNGAAIAPALYRTLPFDTAKDFAPVTQIVASNLALVASPKSGITSVQELLTRARANPGKLNYGSSGPGNPLQLTMEMLKRAAGVDIVAVPFRGDGQIHTALIAGEIEVAVIPLSAAVPLPFVRVDLYGTTKGIVMGEITLLPGGNQHYIPVQDARLGKMWEEAEMRLQIDLARNGRPFRNIAGEHPVPENLRPYLPQA